MRPLGDIYDVLYIIMRCDSLITIRSRRVSFLPLIARSETNNKSQYYQPRILLEWLRDPCGEYRSRRVFLKAVHGAKVSRQPASGQSRSTWAPAPCRALRPVSNQASVASPSCLATLLECRLYHGVVHAHLNRVGTLSGVTCTSPWSFHVPLWTNEANRLLLDAR
jgi:hypothetical protein